MNAFVLRTRPGPRWIFVILVVGVAICGSAQKVKVGYDKSADFSKYHTYTWAKPEILATRPLLYDYVVNSIDSQLEAKGFGKAERDGDLTLIPAGDRIRKQLARWNADPAGIWRPASRYKRNYVDWRQRFLGKQWPDGGGGQLDTGIRGSDTEQGDLERNCYADARSYAKGKIIRAGEKGDCEIAGSLPF